MELTNEEAMLLLIRPTVSSNIISETKAREIEAYNMAIKALRENSIPSGCRSCSNHPKNGGSGICNCILGGVKING